jgi:hypothetical protein
MVHLAWLLWMVAGAVCLGVLGSLVYNLALFKERTIDDIPYVLRRFDEETARELFDQEIEETSRIMRVPVNFRRKQWSRFDLVREYYLCKRHNVLRIVEWAGTEWSFIQHYRAEDEYSPEALASIQVILTLGRKYCLLSSGLLGKVLLFGLLFKLLLRFDRFDLLPVPSVAALARIGKVDMLKLHDAIRSAAVALARTYDEEYSGIIESRM